MSLKVTLGLSVGVVLLLIFAITLGGYFMVNTNEQTHYVNQTLEAFFDQYEKDNRVDNQRFNATLHGINTTLYGLQKTYDQIIETQDRNNERGNATIKLFYTVLDTINNQTAKNLNLTIGNKAKLTDTNEKVNLLVIMHNGSMR